MRSHAPDPVAALAPAIESLTGRTPTAEAMRQFRQYLTLLSNWNRIHRLTGCRSDDAIVGELFLDSLLFLARIPPGELMMVDIGTGPGIPGVPIHLVRPEVSLTLVESRRRSISFLSALKRELDLQGVEIVEGRAEALVTKRPALAEAFDVVVTRAVGMRLLPTAMLYLKRGGLFVAGGSSGLADHQPNRSWSGVNPRVESVVFRRLGLNRTFVLVSKPV